MELRQGTWDWDEVVEKFTHNFSFADEQPIVDVAIQTIMEKIIVEIPI